MDTPIYDQLATETGRQYPALAEVRLTNRPLHEEVLYPEVTAALVGGPASAGAVIALVCQSLRTYLRSGPGALSGREVSAILARFRAEALSGSYDDLLRTCMRWVTVE